MKKLFKWEIGMYAKRKGDKSVFPTIYKLVNYRAKRHLTMQSLIDAETKTLISNVDWNMFEPFFIQKNDEFIEDDGLEIRKAIVKKLYCNRLNKNGDIYGRVKFYDYQTDELLEVREIPLVSLMNDKIFILLNSEN